MQGLQANHMLVVRHNEQGELEVNEGAEGWSCSPEPGRGIPPSRAEERLGIIASWPGDIILKPDGALLDGVCCHAEDLTRECAHDEPPFAA